MPLNIWMAAAELAPLAQTGGLGEILRALPAELARSGYSVRRFLPAYRSVDRSGFTCEAGTLSVPLGKVRMDARFWNRTDAPGLVTTMIDCDQLFDHSEVYGPASEPFENNARRFTFFCRAICERAAIDNASPDILHGHDWPAALLPLFLRFAYPGKPPPRTLFTIHNLAYQGIFPPKAMDDFALEPALSKKLFRSSGVEFFGRLNFLKAALLYADRLTTVSPTYAREIREPEFGDGLDGVLRSRSDAVVGILNGVDNEVWNPERDPHLPVTYNDTSVTKGKAAARETLSTRLSLDRSTRPLVGIIGRLAYQKGIDLILQVLPDALRLGFDFAILGEGDPAYATHLELLQTQFPRRVAFVRKFDAGLSHLMFAATDLLLMPSRYEPCGLSQMYALRYGTIPIVTRTGGLADTVNENVGFIVDALDPAELLQTLRRAGDLRSSSASAWESMRKRGMAVRFSWKTAAAEYARLYESLKASPP